MDYLRLNHVIMHDNEDDTKTVGRRQLLMVSPVIPGVTTILFCRIKKTSTHFKINLIVHTS